VHNNLPNLLGRTGADLAFSIRKGHTILQNMNEDMKERLEVSGTRAFIIPWYNIFIH